MTLNIDSSYMLNNFNMFVEILTEVPYKLQTFDADTATFYRDFVQVYREQLISTANDIVTHLIKNDSMLSSYIVNHLNTIIEEIENVNNSLQEQNNIKLLEALSTLDKSYWALDEKLLKYRPYIDKATRTLFHDFFDDMRQFKELIKHIYY